MPGQLEVWLSDKRIGTLEHVEGRLGFSYAADWLAEKVTRAGIKPGTTPYRNHFRPESSRLMIAQRVPFLPGSCLKATSGA